MKPIRFRSILIMTLLLIFTGCGLTLVHEDRYRGHNWDDYSGYTRDYDGGYYSHRMDHDDGYYGHRMGHHSYYGHRMGRDGDFDDHR